MFEWTIGEFRSWCLEVAQVYGYSVEMSSVGRPIEVDPWGRDNELGRATSVAVFRRQFMIGREERASQLLNILGQRREPHRLMAIHRHPAHPMAKQPKSLYEIHLAVKRKMEVLGVRSVWVERLWMEKDIAVLCGGWMQVLSRAVESFEFLVLKNIGKNNKSAWVIELAPKTGVNDQKVASSKVSWGPSCEIDWVTCKSKDREKMLHLGRSMEWDLH